MKTFKTIVTALLLFVMTGAAIANGTYTNEQMDEDNARVETIVRNIQRNGPAELRKLDPSVIREAARSFVFGERSGALSPAQIARLGGTERAVINSLLGQVKALGR
jgi:hypothetical protein